MKICWRYPNVFDRLIIRLYNWRRPKYPASEPDSQYGTKAECLKKLEEMHLYVPGVTLLHRTVGTPFRAPEQWNPLDHPGIAVVLMDMYGLKLHSGTSLAHIIADHPTKSGKWEWAERSTAQRAICDALIILRGAGKI